MPPATFTDLQGVFWNAVKGLIALGGIVLFVMLVTGGLKFITSGGDPKAVDSAKKTLTYAIGGLVLVLVSYLILYIIQSISGANVTQFQIVKP